MTAVWLFMNDCFNFLKWRFNFMKRHFRKLKQSFVKLKERFRFMKQKKVLTMLLIEKKVLSLQPLKRIRIMKKILLFIVLIAFGLGIKAQSFVATRGDNGDTIKGSTTFLLSAADGGIRFGVIHLTNITDEALAIRVQIEKLQLADSAEVYLCFAGQCNTDTISFTDTIEAGETNEELDVQYWYSNYDLTSVKVNLLNAQDNSIIQSFVVHYDDELVGVLNEVVTNINKASVEIYPNPTNTTTCIKYNVPKDCKTPSVIVKNMLGKEISNVKISNNQSGKFYVNTEKLPHGVYFCSIVCEGQAIATKKLIVRH
jgi:hypothetical protein